ncbi:hypothetical protein [Streptomyces sp. NL15-2K]|nr:MULTISPECIES: hypothetical protein [Actinomycetes]WKX13754.1 hypothetical protein Q4V64_41985 [Kutzneria buriramensis]
MTGIVLVRNVPTDVATNTMAASTSRSPATVQERDRAWVRAF